MKIIISGGTGLIGSALTQSLINDGHQVWILSRNPGRPGHLPAEARLVRWDGQTARGWGDLVNEADALVNLAGESLASGSWTDARKERILSSRVRAGNAMVEAIQQAAKKPKVLVQSSAVGYYGVSEDQIYDEQSPAGNDFLARVCLAWEASTSAVDDLGVRRVIARTGFVLSLAGGAFPQMVLPFRLMAGGPIGTGRQWISWIHLADHIAALRYFLQDDLAAGPYNLTAPAPLTNAGFGKIIGKVMGRPFWLPVPAIVLRLGLGEMSTLILDGQKVLPAKLLSAGFSFRYETAQDALEHLIKR